MSKRPRTSPAAPSSSQQIVVKPSPTPDPPASLVNLLQTDSSVLEYFSALQANIDYDLQLWKNEALQGRKEISRLTKLLKKSDNNNNATASSSNAQALVKMDTSTEQKVSSQRPKRMHELEQQTIKEPRAKEKAKTSTIPSDGSDDDNFLMDLYDEYESNPSDEVEQKDVTTAAQTMSESGHSSQVNYDWLSPILQDLDQCLRNLGVTLVKSQRERQMELDSNSEQTDSTNQNQTTKNVSSLMRRSNLDICTDIFRALRLSIRSPAQFNLYKHGTHSRPPFSLPNFYPCYMESSDPVHPAGDCVQLIGRLLSIVQLFSPSYFGDNVRWSHELKDRLHEINESSTNGDDLNELIVGLKRRNLADVIISSLEGEMCRHWSISDKPCFENAAGIPILIDNSSSVVSDEAHAVGGASVTSSIMQGRLFQLAERASVARIISSFHQSNRDYQRAASIVFNYILQFTPIIGQDNHIYGPCMSLCVLEALLADASSIMNTHDDTINDTHQGSWFGCFLKQLDLMSAPFNTSVGTMVGEALAFIISLAIYIYKLRFNGDDSKSRGISAVELAAYDRFVARESSWLRKPFRTTDYHETMSRKMKEILDLIVGEKEMTGSIAAMLSLPLMLYLVLSGDLSKICSILDDNLSMWVRRVQSQSQDSVIDFLCSCCKAYTIVEKYMPMQSFIDNFSSPTELLRNRLLNYLPETKTLAAHLSLVRCSIMLSDGDLAIKAVDCVLGQLSLLHDRDADLFSSVQQLLEIGSQCPFIRVINLRRRPDRLRAFLNQARHEQLLVMLGVSPLSYEISTGDNFLFYGQHAFDGQGSHLDFEKAVSQYIGPDIKLSSYVSTHWRPSDLKAFDTLARSDDTQVRMSPSERACALSHIGSWIGIERSLPGLTDGLLRSHDEIRTSLLQLFHTTGLARGPALLSENAKNPPSPVFVIMEDDALLVDRFSDRLQLLLNELPRDFHFCSLGYGRPMNAPLLKYSSQLGIPTCIWYLTGYIVSLEGVKFLLQSLPCIGPIDSWIGLKMTANWDNIYGQKVGLGVNSKVIVDMLPPRKDLVRILRFRAFAALVPLCSQKLTSSAKWRDRDTDITYSGKS